MVDLFNAADKSYQTLDSVAARSLASDEAIEERNRLIKDATGVSLANPHRVVPLVPEDEGMPVAVDPWAEYRKGLADLAKRFPEHRKIIQPDLDPRAAANLYGRRAEQDLMRLRAQYGDDWWSSIKGNAAMFAGAMYGMRTDPANLAASMVGFNAARTGFYGLLAASAKNAAANAGIQLAQEPLVQFQRGEAGAASGWEHSAFNVAAAAVFGGALDLGVRATARGVRAARGQVANTDEQGYITGWRHHTEDEPPQPIKVKAATLQKALDGDLDSLKTVTRELKIDDEPEIRALTEAAEIDAELAAKMRENGLDDGTNLRNLAQAIRAATDEAEPPPVQAEDRMVYALARRVERLEQYGIDEENAFNDAIFSQGLNPNKPVRYRGRERYVATERGTGGNSNRSYRLIKKGNQVVGRATIYETDGAVSISRIDVVPKMRQRGIGRQLVEGILHEFEGQQVRTSMRTKLGTELFKRYDDGDGNLVLPGSLADGDGAPSRYRRLVERFVPAWMGRDRFIAKLEAENPKTPAEARRLVGHELQRDTHEITQNTLLGARTRFIDDPERVKRIDDAGGPEARAQIEELEAKVALPIEDVSDKTLYALKAYHGSPHDFDKFKMSQIGTGEGAQAYGHGLYFAESPDVARSYRDQLAPIIGGKALLNPTEAQRGAYVYLRSAGGNHAKAINDLERSRLTDTNPDWQQRSKGYVEQIKDWQKDGVTTSPGRLYEVRINASKDDFLDWDRTIAEQPEKIRAAVRKLTSTHSGDVSVKAVSEPDGSTAYHVNTPNGALITHSKSIADDAAASYRQSPIDEATDTGQVVARGRNEGIDAEIAAKLKEAGIPGIKYLDQGSRGKGEGTYNFVVFDENLIEITAKDGNPVDAAAQRALSQQYSIRAMHASPFIFDKFDMSKLGTGEGQYLPELIGEGGRGHYFTTSEQRVMKYHEDITDGRGEGAIYDVRIEADEDQLLDLDIEIFDQPPHIQAMLEAMGVKTDADMLALPRHEAGQEAMAKAGLKGVAYTEFDGDMTGHQNYVIYDDDAIVITHRDGEPVGDDQRAYLLAERQNAFNRANAVRALTRDGVGSLGAVDQIAQTDLMRSIEPELRREIMDIAERMPEGYGFELAMRLRAPEGMDIDGVTDHLAKTVKVALAAQDPARVARHEEIHVLRELGLIRNDEWSALTRFARKNDLRKKYDIDGRYGEIYGKKFANDPNRVEQMLIEETIAEMWADRIGGTSFGETIDRMIDNVVALLNEIAKALGMKGVQRINQVYRRIESGEIGRRTMTEMRVSRETGEMYAIAGENALTANREALAAAKKLERDGASREDIWDTTGWWRGPDSNWRFEIDDSVARERTHKEMRALKRQLDADPDAVSTHIDHEGLEQAYPRIFEDMSLHVMDTADWGADGLFWKHGTVGINKDIRRQSKRRLSVLMHELQHAIQEQENFARGGSPDHEGEALKAKPMRGRQAQRFYQAGELRVAADRMGMKIDEYVQFRRDIANDADDPYPFNDLTGKDYDPKSIELAKDDQAYGELLDRSERSRPYQVYERLAGEAESRLVQRRLHMTPEERADRPPWLDYDVDEVKQIVHFDNDLGQSTRSESVASVVEVCKL